ncbi:hypothetical protein BURCENBC7_AP7811 [Burkholderia cenocepacia BC7]|nr:hypothetical protein BURCENBC7_AP7811 [Burkholderia cenocepacia BC7]
MSSNGAIHLSVDRRFEKFLFALRAPNRIRIKRRFRDANTGSAANAG